MHPTSDQVLNSADKLAKRKNYDTAMLNTYISKVAAADYALDPSEAALIIELRSN